jgi:hypothetical protein
VAGELGRRVESLPVVCDRQRHLVGRLHQHNLGGPGAAVLRRVLERLLRDAIQGLLRREWQRRLSA